MLEIRRTRPNWNADALRVDASGEMALLLEMLNGRVLAEVLGEKDVVLPLPLCSVRDWRLLARDVAERGAAGLPAGDKDDDDVPAPPKACSGDVSVRLRRPDWRRADLSAASDVEGEADEESESGRGPERPAAAGEGMRSVGETGCSAVEGSAEDGEGEKMYAELPEKGRAREGGKMSEEGRWRFALAGAKFEFEVLADDAASGMTSSCASLLASAVASSSSSSSSSSTSIPRFVAPLPPKLVKGAELPFQLARFDSRLEPVAEDWTIATSASPGSSIVSAGVLSVPSSARRAIVRSSCSDSWRSSMAQLLPPIVAVAAEASDAAVLPLLISLDARNAPVAE